MGSELTHAEMDRMIAERLGWHSANTAGQLIPPGETSYGLGDAPDYATDANAALAAAAKMLPVDFQLSYADLDNLWYARISAVEETDHLERHVWNADTPALAICKMLCAWIEQETK